METKTVVIDPSCSHGMKLHGEWFVLNGKQATVLFAVREADEHIVAASVPCAPDCLFRPGEEHEHTHYFRADELRDGA